MSGRWSVFSRGDGAVGRPLAVAALLVWAASMAAVVYVSLLPDVEIPGDYPDMDKLYHMAGYAWLAFLPCFAFARKRVGLMASLSMIVLGCALEYAQGYVPGRMASLGDMAANTAGVALGVAVGRLLRYRLIPVFRRVVF